MGRQGLKEGQKVVVLTYSGTTKVARGQVTGYRPIQCWPVEPIVRTSMGAENINVTRRQPVVKLGQNRYTKVYRYRK